MIHFQLPNWRRTNSGGVSQFDGFILFRNRKLRVRIWTLEDNEYFCFSSCFEDETKLISSRWTEIGLFQCDFFFSFNREQQENNVHLKTIDCDNRVLQWNVFGKFGFGWVTNKCQNIAINHSFAVLLLKYWTGTLC